MINCFVKLVLFWRESRGSNATRSMVIMVNRKMVQGHGLGLVEMLTDNIEVFVDAPLGEGSFLKKFFPIEFPTSRDRDKVSNKASQSGPLPCHRP